MYYFVNNVNVNKTAFDRFKLFHTQYDLVIDTNTRDMAIFSSTNTDFVFHTTNLYVNYALNYNVTCFDCSHCVDCIMCKKCKNSKDLDYCFNCINCENCSFSSNCKQVTNGKYLTSCANSSVLYMCKEVVDSNNIDYSKLIDSSYDTSFSTASKYIRSSAYICGSKYVTDSDYVQDSQYIGASKFIQSCEIASNCYIGCYSQVIYASYSVENCSFTAHSRHCDNINLMKTSVNTDKKIEEIEKKIVKDIAKYGVEYMFGCIEDNIPYDHRLRKCIDKNIYDKNKDIAKKIDNLEINDQLEFCSECTNVYNCTRCANINDSKFMKNHEGEDKLLTRKDSVECICLTDNDTTSDNDSDDVLTLDTTHAVKRNHADSDLKLFETVKSNHCSKKTKN